MLGTCPFATSPTRLLAKKFNPKTKIKITCAESLVGPSTKRHVPSVGRRHRRVLCRRPQLALDKGQSTGLNPGQRLCRELGRGPSTHVASVPTASYDPPVGKGLFLFFKKLCYLCRRPPDVAVGKEALHLPGQHLHAHAATRASHT
jgi:hypothetical protein